MTLRPWIQFPEGGRAGAALLAMAMAAVVAGPASAQVPVPLDPEEAARLAPIDPRSAVRAASPDLAPPATERFRVIYGQPGLRAGQEGEIRLRALEGFADYDAEEQTLYSHGRVQVLFGSLYLEADRVLVNNRIQEVEADGDIILRNLADAESVNEIRADNMRYNFAAREGVAFGVSGQLGPLFFKTVPSAALQAGRIAPFQQLSAEESAMRNAEVATCDFRIPHYRLRAREILYFANDRVFFRGATVLIGDAPVLYLPFYSRSLLEASPWFVSVGAGRRTGGRLRLGYQFSHESSEPSFEDETAMQTRSSGEARTFADYLTERGIGLGFDYRYSFDYERHEGEIQAYGIRDNERRVGGATIDLDPATEPESERSRLLLRHRTELTDDLTAVVNVDWFSDAEIFFDVLDAFAVGGEELERRPVRRARGAVTLLREAYLARVLIDVKDRAGINRFNNFSDPRDNNLDFDLDPGIPLADVESHGISRDRWGRVGQRLPEGLLATRYLPIPGTPLFALSEGRAYNNLDKGLNTVSDGDDARVRGAQIYEQLLWRMKLSEAMTLLAKLGGGLGVAERDDEDLGVDVSSLPTDANGNFILDGLHLTDVDETFLVGLEEFNYDDLEDAYAWIDAELRLSARLTRALTGRVSWRRRETTDDFIGAFYAEIGDAASREDLFDYPLRENWVESNLTYRLLHPALTLFAGGGINLTSESTRFPNERASFWNGGFAWGNPAGTLRVRGAVGGDSYQLFHPSIPGDGERDLLFVGGRIEYSPVHGRWLVRLDVDRASTSGVKSELTDDDALTLFTDEQDRTRTTLILSRKLGQKWRAQIRLRTDSRLDGPREIAWLLERDLHDAVGVLRVRARRDVRRAESRSDNPTDVDVTVGLRFKLPEGAIETGTGDISTLIESLRAPAIAN